MPGFPGARGQPGIAGNPGIPGTKGAPVHIINTTLRNDEGCSFDCILDGNFCRVFLAKGALEVTPV